MKTLDEIALEVWDESKLAKLTVHHKSAIVFDSEKIDYARRLAERLGAQEPVAWLKEAMDNAAIPTEYRAPLIGYFCNAVNAAPVVREGMQLVPVEPTEKMVKAWRIAFHSVYIDACGYDDALRIAYKAMLAAAKEQT